MPKTVLISLFLVLFCQHLQASCFNITIKEYCTELFKTKGVLGIEYTAYNLLKELAKNNNKDCNEITYLALPWVHLIHRNLLHLVPDIKAPNSFTICQSIHFEEILPLLIKMGVKTVFCPHACKTYKDIDVLPLPFLCVHEFEKFNGPKDIWYSFIGAATNPIRKIIFQQKHPHNTIIIKRQYWHFERDTFKPGCISKEQQQQEKEEYINVLARSRFSLCPPGTGVGTLRFWESLQYGSIPVILADDLLLPEGFNWDSCTIRIPEKEVKKIAKILKKIPLKKEEEMRAACLKAYNQFSGENFISPILYHYEKKTS